MLGKIGDSRVGKFVASFKRRSSGATESKAIDQCQSLMARADAALNAMEVQTKGARLQALRDRYEDLGTALARPNPAEAELMLHNVILLNSQLDAFEAVFTEDTARLATFDNLIASAKRESDDAFEDDDGDNPDQPALDDANNVALLAQTQLFNAGALDPEMLDAMETCAFRLKVIFTARFDRVSIERAERITVLTHDAVNKPGSDAARFLKGAEGDIASIKTLAAGVQALEEAAQQDFSRLGETQDLSFEELMALHLYTTDKFAPINQLMLFPDKFKGSRERREALETQQAFVEEGLHKLPAYPRAAYPLVRWENGNYDWRAVYRQGATFRNKQFYSAGATDGASTGGTSITVKLIIKIYGHSGKDIAMLSAARGEGAKKSAVPMPAYVGKGEVLFAPGASFLVISVQEGPVVDGQVQEVLITLIEQPS